MEPYPRKKPRPTPEAVRAMAHSVVEAYEERKRKREVEVEVDEPLPAAKHFKFFKLKSTQQAPRPNIVEQFPFADHAKLIGLVSTQRDQRVDIKTGSLNLSVGAVRDRMCYKARKKNLLRPQPVSIYPVTKAHIPPPPHDSIVPAYTLAPHFHLFQKDAKSLPQTKSIGTQIQRNSGRIMKRKPRKNQKSYADWKLRTERITLGVLLEYRALDADEKGHKAKKKKLHDQLQALGEVTKEGEIERMEMNCTHSEVTTDAEIEQHKVEVPYRQGKSSPLREMTLAEEYQEDQEEVEVDTSLFKQCTDPLGRNVCTNSLDSYSDTEPDTSPYQEQETDISTSSDSDLETAPSSLSEQDADQIVEQSLMPDTPPSSQPEDANTTVSSPVQWASRILGRIGGGFSHLL